MSKCWCVLSGHSHGDACCNGSFHEVVELIVGHLLGLRKGTGKE